MKYHISINKMTVRDTDPVSYYLLTDNKLAEYFFHLKYFDQTID